MQELKKGKEVILVSPPYMDISHPSYHIPLALTKGCNYMNPGLLIASSILDEHNISNCIVKICNSKDITDIERNIGDDTVLIGISCTCAWEYLESLEIAKRIKENNKNVKIVISGWQIKSIGLKTFEDSSNIDYIITGDAEYTIYELYKRIVLKEDNKIPSLYKRGEKIENNYNYPNIEFRPIDFSKFPNYKEYVPYVEESRNCPYNCTFCLNSCVMDKYQNVPIDIFIKNVENIEKLYGENIQANLLAANFGVCKEETKRKLEYLKTKKLKWNIEFHVDNKWEYYISDLKKSGVNKASIGVESASPTTLKLMNKTQSPDNYLKRLEQLLIELNKQDIKPSLNILFDYRDNEQTIKETLNYLEEHKKMFKKVKGNFMFIFDGLMDTIDYNYHPNIIIDNYGSRIHAFPILPTNFDINSMSSIINEIENGNYSIKIQKKLKK